MSIAQSSLSLVSSGVSPPPLVCVALPAAAGADGAGLDERWAAWQARGRARDAAVGERLTMAGLIAVIAGAFAGAVRLSFGGPW